MTTELGHMGDGVYLSHDGYQLWLAANHHDNKTVALDSGAFLNVIRGAGKLWGGSALANELRKMADEMDPQEDENDG